MLDDFDEWNRIKKSLHGREGFPYASPREIWWCALGRNVGVEINGKHEQFERPVIILHAFNTEMLKVVPLTTRGKSNRFYLQVPSAPRETYAVLSQARVISARRLLRLIGKVTPEEFIEIKEGVKALDI
jgi:mRNA interferase MazF